MKTKDERLDNYIAKAADFSQPILQHLRKLVHTACPDVEETMKWSFPHFDYKGMMCSMAAFKAYCAFTFWKGEIMSDPHLALNPIGKTAMGHLGKLSSLDDLPADAILIQYIKEAMRLNDEGIKVPAKAATAKKDLTVPDYFLQAVKSNKLAHDTYEGFNYSNKKEYVEWVTEAKTAATREKRMATSVEWMAEGKIKNWKYVKK